MNMPLALLNRRRRGAVAFSPTALFALAEPGVWYDPSDLTTLFQDTAGTTPVTTPGQTVALALDKSKGLVLGSELVTNGDFSSGTTGWTVGPNLSASVVSGRLELTTTGSITASNAFRQIIPTVAGRTYKIGIDIIVNAGFARNYTDGAGASIPGFGSSQILGTGRYEVFVVATGAEIRLNYWCTSGQTTVFDNVSVKELPGFHATQATAGSRPIYGIVPVGGRRNLLTFTEQFDNAAWVKGSSTVVVNNAVAPDGTTTADLLYPASSGNNRWVYQTYSGTSNIYTRSVYAKASGKDFLCIDVDGGGTNGAYFNLSTGAVGTVSAGYTASIQSVGSGWYRCSVRNTSNQTLSFGGVYAVVDADNSRAATASGTNGVLIWGAQLETGSAATAYQKVTTQYDVTEAGVSSLSYLAFDGVDDFLVTPTITPGIDKAQVFAGVRKIGTAIYGIVAELSAAFDGAGNFGTFALAAPGNNSANYFLAGGGNPSRPQNNTLNYYPSPITNVLTATLDIAGDLTKLRVNAVEALSSSTDLGAGNFLAYPLYIGRRGGTTLPFNGNLFSLIVRFGANLTTEQITATETWVNGKTRAY